MENSKNGNQNTESKDKELDQIIIKKFKDKYTWVKRVQYPSVGEPNKHGIYRTPDGGWKRDYKNWCAITIRPGDDKPYEVHGAICKKWYEEGEVFDKYGKEGRLGYPISDEEVYLGDGNSADRVSHFEHGDIIWSAAKKTTRVVKKKNKLCPGEGQREKSAVDLYLSHNPYTIKTEFSIDGKACDEEPWFVDLTKQDGFSSRLQMWIEEFFDKFHHAYPAVRAIYLTYRGTTADCCDVEEEAAAAERRLGIQIRVKYNPCGDPADKFVDLRRLYDKAIDGPYEDFHKLKMEGDFDKIEDRLLSVSIMAPMKNGKSTLLNAILGRELLPSATQRCTAKISYIEHCEGLEKYEAKKIEGNGASSMYYPCTKQLLAEWNENKNVHNVRIRGALPGFHIHDYRLQFVDTPGPDSALHVEDRLTIERFLNDNSLPMVCYIIDRINSSETDYLERIKENMKRFGKQSQDRFIFIVSRMDQIQISKDNTKENNPIKAKIDEIKVDLRKLGISNPRVFPVSAMIALKAREFMSLDEQDQDDARSDIKKFHRGLKRINSSLLDFTSVSSAIKNKIEAEIAEIAKKENDEIELSDDLRLAELLSGIPALELTIEEYATKYSVPARIYDAATIFDQGIQKAHATEKIINKLAKHETTLSEIREKIENLRHYLFLREGAHEMREKLFPEKWVESVELKNKLIGLDTFFESQISKELSNWNPQSLDKDGNIKPYVAESLLKGFIEGFMGNLSTQMLSLYANAVESDAHYYFTRLRNDYKIKIQEILGEMPENLKSFMDNVSFVLDIDPHINLSVKEFVMSKTEEYIRHFRRKITWKEDGFWGKIWALVPFTSTETDDKETIKRIVEHVPYGKFKSEVKKAANLIYQDGHEQAIDNAKTNYGELRQIMMKLFDDVDEKLREYGEELKKWCDKKEKEKQKVEENRKVLEWVKCFEYDLKHILDLGV